MRKWKMLPAIILAFGFLSVSSCSNEEKEDPIGKWPPIKLTVNGAEYNSITYAVPAEGGEYKLYSSNYGSLWLNSVKENDDVVWYSTAEDFSKVNVSGEWYTLNYDSDGNIVVNINAAKADNKERTIYLELECGDAFSSIQFKQ